MTANETRRIIDSAERSFHRAARAAIHGDSREANRWLRHTAQLYRMAGWHPGQRLAFSLLIPADHCRED